MEVTLQHIVNALSLGSLYALIALGIALIFGIMQLINFAHGELIMGAGYALLLIGIVPWQVAIPAVVAGAIALALAMERVAFRPVRGESATTLLVTSFAVSFLLQSLALFVFGARPKSVSLPSFVAEGFVIGDVQIPKLHIVTVFVTFGFLASLAFFFKFARLGIQMRAAAEDFLMSLLVGVRADRVIASAFALSGLLAGVAAVLFVGQTATLTPIMGLTPLIVGVVATVIGGMGSLLGAVVGGYLLGFVSVALQVLLPVELRPFRDAFVFSAVIAVLLFRPQGLLAPASSQARI
jgi:branched-chain amino acid transport system permease protein